MRTPSTFLVTLVCACLNGVPHAAEYADSTRLKAGDQAPAFECVTLSGEPLSLEKEKGKVVVINFFATWCGPCLAEMPHLQKDVFERFESRKDFRFVAIGREHDAAELKRFAKEKKIGIPMAPDPKRKIYGLFAEKYIPRNVVIGKDGKIRFTSVGYEAKEFKGFVAAVAKALDE